MNLSAANEVQTSTIEMRFRVVVDLQRAKSSSIDIPTLVCNEVVSHLQSVNYISAVDIDFIDVAEPTFEEHFGLCPECGKSDGWLNIGRTHVFYCDAHRTRWTVGANLFDSWKHEDEAIWRRNAEHLHDYRDVDPMHRRPQQMNDGESNATAKTT